MATAAPHSTDVESSGGSFEHDHKHPEGVELDHEGKEVHKSEGVRRMEALAAEGYATKSGKHTLYAIGLCVFIMYWMYCQQESTTYTYSVWATSSFSAHSSGLSALSVATSIISSVCGPFLAQGSNIFGRPWICIVSLVAYVVGFVMILKSPNLATYVVGNVFTSIGGSGLGLLSTVLSADLVPLKYRGLSAGILSAPYLVIPWYSSEIASALSSNKDWRWGYGMYCIIMPVVMIPCISMLFWLQHKAKKDGLLNIASPGDALSEAAYNEKAGHENNAAPPPAKSAMPLGQRLVLAWHELDGFGLLLLGFGWSLLLLPFSLASGADGGYRNRSLIAMFVVGGLCLIAYCFFEAYWSKYPTAPIRLLKNRTFCTAVIIDFMYELAGYCQLLYLSSYAYIVTDWDTREWNYWGNTLTVGLCFGGVIAGLIQRYTRRYKWLQVGGVALKIIAYGLLVDKSGVHDTARLVISQALTGISGSFSVVGSQVASQASVPHQDVALVISLLSLWSSIGAAIGSAVASAVWGAYMPGNLRKYIPSTVNDTMIETFFESITVIKDYDYNSDVRQGAIKAYEATVYPLWAAALGLSFISLIAACFQSDYYLGDAQNAYDRKDVAGNLVVEEQDADKRERSTGWTRHLRFWQL